MKRICIPILVALAALWLWPVGLGGRMPVGGDVTQFSMGLTSYFRGSIAAGRLPIWNERWGLGFPGLAESQMGVYYPPNIVLFGALSNEVATAASLVLHAIWGALGVYFAARRCGISREGGVLAGASWACSGFFLIHLPHQWAATTGSWMPWAWGLAWSLMRGEAPTEAIVDAKTTPTAGGSGRRDSLLLAAVLALQILPGHFQLAFNTQVCVLAIGVFCRLEGCSTGRLLRLVGAFAGAFALSTAQLLPTLRLARLAADQRDFNYLAGFAATPLHLISFVAPGLWHRSPLWRPLIWDSFHTSPEEYLGYLGVVPLMLAAGTLARGIRRDPAVRVLAGLAVLTLCFSLGPYVPGFRWLCGLPGFSFFRAPSRWTLGTTLALALLAGRGFDAWLSWERRGRLLLRAGAAALLMTGTVAGLLELAFRATEPRGSAVVAGVFESVLGALSPWPGDPGFRVVMRWADRSQGDDRRVRAWLARQGVVDPAPRTMVLRGERFSIYANELGASCVLWGCLIVLAPWAGRHAGATRAVLVMIALVDLMLWRDMRTIDLGALRSLTDQSPILTRMAGLGPGARVLDGSRNLPMVAGAAPTSAYRTLDLPALTALVNLAGTPLSRAERVEDVFEAADALGASARVLDAFETAEAIRSGRIEHLPAGWTAETVRDPALASWLYGRAWSVAAGDQLAMFTFIRRDAPPARARLLDLTPDQENAVFQRPNAAPSAIATLVNNGRPLEIRSRRPEHIEIDVIGRARGPARRQYVLIPQLADPAWRAHWVGPDRESRVATIEPAFARSNDFGCQAVRLPDAAGAWSLVLDLDATDVTTGLLVSSGAWIIWVALWLRPRRRRVA